MARKSSRDAYSDDEDAREDFRDYEATRSVLARGTGRACLAPKCLSGGRASGGGIRRMTVGGVAPSWEDEARIVAEPGRYVPLGFARYVSPVLDPADYTYYHLAGWRVAIPLVTPPWSRAQLLQRIYYFGPQSAGYVRIGDVLVPAVLGSGDRATLSQTASPAKAFGDEWF